MSNHNCVFIVFEGLNCSGKTTQRELLATYLGDEFTEKRRGSRSIYITSQPGATSDSCERLKCKREYALSITIDDYIRDRAYHAPYLEEALHRGDILLCSRYTASTAAYQGNLDPATLEYIHSENDRVTHGLAPDLVIYLSITPQEAMRRLKERDRSGDDQFTLEQLQLIAAGYCAEESYCTSRGQKWLTFHASDSVDGIADKIRNAAIKLIEAKTNALP